MLEHGPTTCQQEHVMDSRDDPDATQTLHKAPKGPKDCDRGIGKQDFCSSLAAKQKVCSTEIFHCIHAGHF